MSESDEVWSSEEGTSDDQDFEDLIRQKLLAKRAQEPSNRAPGGQGRETSVTQRKLSEVGYKDYLQEFDQVFESREGFSVQSNITGAVLQAGRGAVKWVGIGTKAALVINPGSPGEERYEIRPCLKVAVHSLTAADNETRKCIAQAIVKSVEKRHGKYFSSEDYDTWLDFIEAAVSDAGLLCNSHLKEECGR